MTSSDGADFDSAADISQSEAYAYTTKEVDISDIQVGHVVQVLPGESIPTDGIIIFGNTYVDESMISGESIPKAKAVEDEVFGGTINQYGMIQVRTTKVGEDAALNQIVRIVEEAQMSKAPIQVCTRVYAEIKHSVTGDHGFHCIPFCPFCVWYCNRHLRGVVSCRLVL